MNNNILERTILVCQGSGCNSLNAEKILRLLNEKIKEKKLSERVKIKLTGCHGFCQVGPTLIIEPDNVLYINIKEKYIEDIVENHLIHNNIIEKYLYKDPISEKYIKNIKEIDFYKEQYPIITKKCGKINPEEINDYISKGGYESFIKVLNDFSPLDVIEEIKKSGLRGRGGAGFSTGQKWSFCKNAIGDPKYLICNGDEGDPGAFMDRTLLESDPHSVIEGMLIAGYAIGCSIGYAYIRAEYPLAIKRFEIALDQAKKAGLLGQNIKNTDFNFEIILKRGAGAFVCGEETALMASIMGKRGMPKSKPPYPATSGLWKKPTNINNVKTLATVPIIIGKGAEWYRSIGTEDSPGTILLALTGKIKNSGLVELPLGTKISRLIYNIGGGILNDKKFKAVQTGGPSGGCIPEKFLDTPLDYKNLTELGSIMGSGGFIVLDEETCMVELARYFIEFTQNESCGKCIPCRIGTKRMLDILTNITTGKGTLEELEELEKIANVVKLTSLCGLGQTAPNPVLTTLKYFREEYIAHVLNKSCPALVCKDLIEYYIDQKLCTGCGLCKINCPEKAIEGESKKSFSIDLNKCIKCGVCFSSCSYKAIYKKTNKN